MAFWPKHWLLHLQLIFDSSYRAGIDGSDKPDAEDTGVAWQKQGPGKEKDCYEEFDKPSEVGRYRESDWDFEIDAEGMTESFQTMRGWNSMLDVVMSMARLSKSDL